MKLLRIKWNKFSIGFESGERAGIANIWHQTSSIAFLSTREACPGSQCWKNNLPIGLRVLLNVFKKL